MGELQARLQNHRDNLAFRCDIEIATDDPSVGVLRVVPRTAEVWDGPSSQAVMVFEFLKSQIIGTEPNLGENRKTTITFSDMKLEPSQK